MTCPMSRCLSSAMNNGEKFHHWEVRRGNVMCRYRIEFDNMLQVNVDLGTQRRLKFDGTKRPR